MAAAQQALWALDQQLERMVALGLDGPDLGAVWGGSDLIAMAAAIDSFDQLQDQQAAADTPQVTFHEATVKLPEVPPRSPASTCSGKEQHKHKHLEAELELELELPEVPPKSPEAAEAEADSPGKAAEAGLEQQETSEVKEEEDEVESLPELITRKEAAEAATRSKIVDILGDLDDDCLSSCSSLSLSSDDLK